MNNNTCLAIGERERIQNLINHWQLNNFETNATNWWSVIAYNHSKCSTFKTLMHTWIDDIQTFDVENFETSTDGLR